MGGHPVNKTESLKLELSDLLTLTQLHTASLEDHAKHLTKRVDGLRNLISSAKATGAVKKLLPSAVTGFALKPEPVEVAGDDSELEKVEKRWEMS